MLHELVRLRYGIVAVTIIVVLWNIWIPQSAIAQIELCGNPPQGARDELTERVYGDLKGRAQFLSKLSGASLAGSLKSERREVFQKYSNVDRFVLDKTFIHILCLAIMSDKNATLEEKTKRLIEMRREMNRQPKASINSSTFKLVRWFSCGWNVAITNPTDGVATITRAGLIVKRTAYRDLFLPIQLARPSIPPSGITHTAMRVCGRYPSGMSNLRAMQREIHPRNRQCQLCLTFLASSGDETQKCEKFSCNRVPFPRPR